MAKFIQLKSFLTRTTKVISPVKAVAAVKPDDLRQRRNIPAGFEPDIDFSAKLDLESYVQGLDISASNVEGWISTGLLFPDEIRVAEKMLKIIRKGSKRLLN